MDRWQIYDYSHYGVKWEIWPTGEWVKYDEATADIEAVNAQCRNLADDNASLLDLLSRIRFALGDNGKRMQSELIEYCAELRALAQAEPKT